MGRAEEGIGLTEKAMRLNPRYPIYYIRSLGWAYRVAELGRLEEARAEMAEALRLNPTFSLEKARQMYPFKDPADLERFLDDLRKAGLK